MSPELKQALEALDQAIDRLEGRVEASNGRHAALLARLKQTPGQDPGREAAGEDGGEAAADREATIAGRLDLAIERIESVLEEGE